MEFIEPCKDGLTVYSKSDCRNCDYVKALLFRCDYRDVKCDKYLENDKEAFKSFMFHHMGFIPADMKIFFPLVFYKGRFLKSYKSILDYIN